MRPRHSIRAAYIQAEERYRRTRTPTTSMVLNNDTLEDYVATAGGKEVAAASGKNEKSAFQFEGAVVVPADHDPDTVPTADDLKTLRRVPAALP